MWGFANLRRDSEFDGASLDCEGLSVDQGVSDFFVCGFENSAEGLPGNVHFLRGVLLIKSLQVG
jgi:hypothetical protein